jgi:hypothetical protein
MKIQTYKVESKSNPGTFHNVEVMEVSRGFAFRCDCKGYTSRKQKTYLVVKDWSCSHIRDVIARVGIAKGAENEK